jgi:hypothetical protein
MTLGVVLTPDKARQVAAVLGAYADSAAAK